jgi:hypothetical protein
MVLEAAEGGKEKHTGQQEQKQGASAGAGPLRPLLSLGGVEIHEKVPMRIGMYDRVEGFVTDKILLV